MTAVKSDNLEYLCDLPRLKKNRIGSIISEGASGLKLMFLNDLFINRTLKFIQKIFTNNIENM